MIDLTKLNVLLDAIAKCKGRYCDDCRKSYDVGFCPISALRSEAKGAQIAIEKYLNKQHNPIITEEMFMDILTEFNND